MDFHTILIGVTAAVGFYMAFNVGANDVANAMGTSVGAGTLRLGQAILVAAVFEFCGAFFVGGHVTNTIRKGIIDPTLYAAEPYQLAYGMIATLLAAAVWLNIATHRGWPVSTTHSIVGAIAGFGIITRGMGSISWGTLLAIASSWILSPLLGGLLAAGTFLFIKRYILFSPRPMLALRRIAPWLVMMVVTIISLSLVVKGLKNLHLDFPLKLAIPLSLGAGAVAAVISGFFLLRIPIHARWRIGRRFRTIERVFMALQILTACYLAFSHGANDVANAIGPMAAAVMILQEGSIATQVMVPTWVLLFGGIGIVTGLAIFGYKVIRTIGERIVSLTPSRGFSAELGAATTVLLASKLGLPVSTTHTLVGAVFGVGLVRGVSALNLRVVRGIVVSWFVTIPVAAILTLVFYGLANLVLG